MSLKEMPESERPRERLAQLGADNLTTAELLAILITSGNSKHCSVFQIAENLLNHFENDLGFLFSASIEELSKVEGIGFAKACQFKAAFELGMRAAFCLKEMHPLISSTQDVVDLLSHQMMYKNQEEFRVVLLNSKNRMIRAPVISLGSLDSALVQPRDVFRPAVAHSAASIILVHNHPSGDPTPSEPDILLTQELCMCGKILGIEVLDHIIIGTQEYVSMKLRELM